MTHNFRFYRIHSDWADSEEELAGQLQNTAFKPCGAFSERSAGFEAPVEGAGDLLCRRLAGADLVQLRLQTRVLPLAAVNEALVEREAAFKQRTARDPSRKERRELKDEIYAELLPKALLKSDRIRAFYLRKEQILVVSTQSATNAEVLLDKLRESFGSLQAVPLEFKQPTSSLLTRIFLGDGPDEFALGRECRMRDASDTRSTVNWLDMDIADRTVRSHVKNGLAIDRLAVRFDAVVGCTIDQELVVRKLRLEGIEELDDLDDEDALARHDAEFTLLSGIVARLLISLKKNLGGFAV